MKILITGAAGSIGSELVRQLHKENTVFGLDQNETGIFNLINEYKIEGRVGNVSDTLTCSQTISTFQPDLIFHAAAYKHVSTMEHYPTEAVHTNIEGTANMLHWSKIMSDHKFVFVSTDKAVNPTGIMGASKMVGEVLTRNAGGIVVRFGNVLGSRGSVIPIWEEQLAKNKPLTVTNPAMKRYFMTIEDAVDLLIHAGMNGEDGRTYVMDMGEPISVLEMAKQILVERGKTGDEIEIIGQRPGERLVEELMTAEEKERAVKEGRFWKL